MAVLEALSAHGGWLATNQVAEAAGVGRDQARRILRTLAEQGWAHRMDVDGRDAWTIGPRLPFLGLSYQETILRRARALQADALAALPRADR